MTESWSATAVPATVPLLRGRVVAFASAAHVPDPPLSDVRLAVSEALTNVVLHGYRGLPEPGPIEVTATMEPDALHIVIADEGV
ncbi:MAG TPA: ATP-binding protein, partial [Solirubrobacteraceae bacterium]